MVNQTLMKVNHPYSKNLSEKDKFEEEYVFIDKSMVGLYIAIFVKRKLTNRIRTKSF